MANPHKNVALRNRQVYRPNLHELTFQEQRESGLQCPCTKGLSAR